MSAPRTSATAFAPASVGNVGVGFDILGHSVGALGDRVQVTRAEQPGVRILEIRGTAPELPMEAERNTAGKALLAMVDALELDFGLDVVIEKGIPLGSGLGGSAASAVAAVVAASALSTRPVEKIDLLKFAMQGEAVASGSVHVDNIAPSLFGGLILTVGVDAPRIKMVPVPPAVRCVLVHPHMTLSTKEARRILKKTVELSDVVWQTANLAGFLSACYTNDLEMMRDAFHDVMIEPQRQVLIPGFKAVKQAAMACGAIGCSISGAGPTLFAWCEEPQAEGVRAAMVSAFAEYDLPSDGWISSIDADGARVLP